MKTTADFPVGSNVYVPGVLLAGVVREQHATYIVIDWEDGGVGLMYPEADVVPSIQRLCIGDKMDVPP